MRYGYFDNEHREYVIDRMEPPDFGAPAERVNREDGCKIYFADGSWTICRFSGTEPLLRAAEEGNTPSQAEGYLRVWRQMPAL